MARKKSAASAKRRHTQNEHQYRNILFVGVAFVTVMIIAIGAFQSRDALQARVYAPMPTNQIQVKEPSEELSGGACCAAGECLDLERNDCTGEGYVYWPDADLCMTTCKAIQ